MSALTNAKGTSCSVLLVKYCEDNETEDDEMGWACGKKDTEQKPHCFEEEKPEVNR
jgi:hypothetical protein